MGDQHGRQKGTVSSSATLGHIASSIIAGLAAAQYCLCSEHGAIAGCRKMTEYTAKFTKFASRQGAHFARQIAAVASALTQQSPAPR
jgi:hypothetical protein